jgi:peptide/nickel transport system ATP-binding protein
MKGVCDTLAPPQREMAPRHIIACHLDEATLRAMQPVITIEPRQAAVELVGQGA